MHRYSASLSTFHLSFCALSWHTCRIKGATWWHNAAFSDLSTPRSSHASILQLSFVARIPNRWEDVSRFPPIVSSSEASRLFLPSRRSAQGRAMIFPARLSSHSCGILFQLSHTFRLCSLRQAWNCIQWLLWANLRCLVLAQAVRFDIKGPSFPPCTSIQNSVLSWALESWYVATSTCLALNLQIGPLARFWVGDAHAAWESSNRTSWVRFSHRAHTLLLMLASSKQMHAQTFATYPANSSSHLSSSLQRLDNWWIGSRYLDATSSSAQRCFQIFSVGTQRPLRTRSASNFSTSARSYFQFWLYVVWTSFGLLSRQIRSPCSYHSF